jgi:uncharacterized membrane-anchored protein
VGILELGLILLSGVLVVGGGAVAIASARPHARELEDWLAAGLISTEQASTLRAHRAAATFIRGWVASPGIRYGIETFYVEEGQGPKYEAAMARQSLYAHVVLDDDGDAELDDLTLGTG